ncbi:MAG TPA: hypothetical protein VMC79_15740, partial [Rectinemataceae bacterium]|nr:hypothetical protein [Rectinemataceae bacterium]
PPSRLKREKNRCYRESAVALDALWSSAAAAAAAWMPPPPGTADRVLHAPPRSVLVIGGGEGQPSLPFATARALREDRPLPFLQGAHWLPLAPLVADWEEYVSLLRRRVSTVVTGGGDIILGLDGLHHLALARSLVDELAPLDPERRHLRFFLDIHLYVANRFTFATVANLPWLAGRLLFAYFYLEAGREDFTRLHASCGEAWPELAEVDADFSPPLFLSAACLRKQHGEGGSCPPGCDRLWKRRLRDRDRGYLAVVEDCVSMVFQEGRIRSATS